MVVYCEYCSMGSVLCNRALWTISLALVLILTCLLLYFLFSPDWKLFQKGDFRTSLEPNIVIFVQHFLCCCFSRKKIGLAFYYFSFSFGHHFCKEKTKRNWNQSIYFSGSCTLVDWVAILSCVFQTNKSKGSFSPAESLIPKFSERKFSNPSSFGEDTAGRH